MRAESLLNKANYFWNKHIQKDDFPNVDPWCWRRASQSLLCKKTNSPSSENKCEILYLLALSFQLRSRTFSHTVACARPTWRPAAPHSWASSGARSASRSKRASSSCLPRHQFQRVRRTSRSRHSCPLWGQRRSRPEKGYFFIPTFISQKICHLGFLWDRSKSFLNGCCITLLSNEHFFIGTIIFGTSWVSLHPPTSFSGPPCQHISLHRASTDEL